MTDFIYALGRGFYWFFSKQQHLGNIPNFIFLMIGFFGLFYWLSKQNQLNKKAQQGNTLK